MAAIFEPVTIGWDGKEYTITPTMRLLNRVEQHVSISAMAHAMAMGEPRITHLATAVAVFLQSAGVKVTDEEVYQVLMHAEPDEIYATSNAIVEGAFPVKKDDKKGNEKAPAKAKKPQK